MGEKTIRPVQKRGRVPIPDLRSAFRSHFISVQYGEKNWIFTVPVPPAPLSFCCSQLSEASLLSEYAKLKPKNEKKDISKTRFFSIRKDRAQQKLARLEFDELVPCEEHIIFFFRCPRRHWVMAVIACIEQKNFYNKSLLSFSSLSLYSRKLFSCKVTTRWK